MIGLLLRTVLLLTSCCSCSAAHNPLVLACSGNTLTELSRMMRTNRDWLVSTRSLELRDCLVPRTFWQEVRELGKLENLTLNRVSFETRTIASGSFHGLQLRHLIVVDTDLHSVEPGAFNQLEVDDIVFLRNEQFWLQDAMFYPLRTVGLIEIAGSNVSVIPTRTFEDLTVGELCLENNGLEQFPVAALRAMRDLRALNLRANLLRVVPSHCLQFASLSELILAECRIEQVAQDAFVDLPSLQSIDLSENQLPELAEGTFKENFNLEVVRLRSNELSSLPDSLFDWASLSVLDLHHNRWDCSCQLGWILMNVRIPINVSCDSPYFLRDQQLLEIHPQQCLQRTTTTFTLPTGRFVDVGWLQRQTVRRRRLTTARRPRPWLKLTTTPSSTRLPFSTPSRSSTSLKRLSSHSTALNTVRSTLHDHADVTVSPLPMPLSTSTSALVKELTTTVTQTSMHHMTSTVADLTETAEHDRFPPEYLLETYELLGVGGKVDAESDAMPIKSVGGFTTNPTIAAILIVIGLLLATFLLLTILIVTASNIRKRLLTT